MWGSVALAKRLVFHGVSGGLPLPLTMDLASLAAVFVMMLPVAMFFSATMLAIALFSRSSKEAQSYLQPLLIVTILPAVASLLPGVELNSRLALVPVVNVSLVAKENPFRDVPLELHSADLWLDQCVCGGRAGGGGGAVQAGKRPIPHVTQPPILGGLRRSRASRLGHLRRTGRGLIIGRASFASSHFSGLLMGLAACKIG